MICFGFYFRLCGYIISTAPEVYVCHVFQCVPNAAALTKALAEACEVSLKPLIEKNKFSYLVPLLFFKIITGEKLLKYQENSPWMIILLVLMTSGIE